MAWNPQGGGQGPWGRGPSGGGGGGGPTPPDIEEMLRRSQEKFKRMMPGGIGAGRGLVLAVVAVMVLWLVSGVYRVQPGEQGVELLFGEYVKRTGPGLHFWFPPPIGEVIRPNVERVNVINIGFRGSPEGGRGVAPRSVPEESLMLTGDQNIVDVHFVVQWRIKDAGDFLFKIRNPEGTVKIAAESAIREVIGQTPLDRAITVDRQMVDQRTRELLQEILDSYDAGIHIADVKQQKVDPPAEVIDAFHDVQRANQDRERQQNEAFAYQNDILPKAKGEAERMIQEATGYRDKVVQEAEGEAQRFLQVNEAFQIGGEVMARRLFLERMGEVLKDADKMILDFGGEDGGSNILPYLPLPELKKRSQESGQ